MNFKNAYLQLFSIAVFTLSIFLTPEISFGASAESITCKPEKVNDPKVQGRALSVSFPDGRKITIVGHVHGTRQIYELNDLLKEKTIDQISDTQLESVLKKIIQENQKGLIDYPATVEQRKILVSRMKKEFGVDVSEIIKPEEGFDIASTTVLGHAYADYDYLDAQMQLPEGKRPYFIGYEGSQNTLSRWFPGYQFINDLITEETKTRRSQGRFSMNEREVHEALLSATNGQVYYFVKNPHAFKKSMLVGVKDEAAGQAEHEADTGKTLDAALNALIKVDNDYADSLSEDQKKKLSSTMAPFIAFFQSLHSNVKSVSFESLQEFEDEYTKLIPYIPSWLKQAMKQYYQSAKNRLILMEQRNQASARNLTHLKSNAIYFVGLNHLRNVAVFLSRNCLQEKNNSSTANEPSSINYGYTDQNLSFKPAVKQ